MVVVYRAPLFRVTEVFNSAVIAGVFQTLLLGIQDLVFEINRSFPNRNRLRVFHRIVSIVHSEAFVRSDLPRIYRINGELSDDSEED